MDENIAWGVGNNIFLMSLFLQEVHKFHSSVSGPVPHGIRIRMDPDAFEWIRILIPKPDPDPHFEAGSGSAFEWIRILIPNPDPEGLEIDKSKKKKRRPNERYR
jgi:hypothetical protein